MRGALMGFYYGSLFSLIPLGIAYVAMALVFWGVAVGTRGIQRRRTVLVITALVLLVLPISEELWIAWNFGQACKQAGTFIHKKVAVDGFYDDTRSTHAGEPTQQAAESFDRSGYRFLEMKGPKGGVVHIEKVNGRWRSTLLERPTARYQYQSRSHIPESRKVVKHESIVVDTHDQQAIGRETIFGRYAPWFFVGLDAPQMQCHGVHHVPGLVYKNVLLPNR
jgi:hypothetical protein